MCDGIIMSLDTTPFDRLKARYILPAYFGAMAAPYFILPYPNTAAANVLVDYLSYTLMGYILYLFALAYEVDIKRLFSASQYSVDVSRLTVGIALPVSCVSIASIWLVYYPLSFLWPDFVEYWLLDSPPLVFWSEGRFLWLTNFANLLFICVLVPCVEEVLFRGFLLQRWAKQWGISRAVIISSLLFGILHADIVGGIIFGYVMCVLYIQTKSLWAPIVAHGINNGIAWVFSCAEEVNGVVDTSIAEFQQHWWIGGICFFVSLPWLIHYFKSNHPKAAWAAPYDA